MYDCHFSTEIGVRLELYIYLVRIGWIGNALGDSELQVASGLRILTLLRDKSLR